MIWLLNKFFFSLPPLPGVWGCFFCCCCIIKSVTVLCSPYSIKELVWIIPRGNFAWNIASERVKAIDRWSCYVHHIRWLKKQHLQIDLSKIVICSKVFVCGFVCYVTFHSTSCTYTATHIQHIVTPNQPTWVAVFQHSVRCMCTASPVRPSRSVLLCLCIGPVLPQLCTHSFPWPLYEMWTWIWKQLENLRYLCNTAVEFFLIPCLGNLLFNSSHHAAITAVKLVAVKLHKTLLSSQIVSLTSFGKCPSVAFMGRALSCCKLTQSVELHGWVVTRDLVLDFLLDVCVISQDLRTSKGCLQTAGCRCGVKTTAALLWSYASLSLVGVNGLSQWLAWTAQCNMETWICTQCIHTHCSVLRKCFTTAFYIISIPYTTNVSLYSALLLEFHPFLPWHHSVFLNSCGIHVIVINEQIRWQISCATFHILPLGQTC